MEDYTYENETADEERRMYRNQCRKIKKAERRKEKLKLGICMIAAATISTIIVVQVMILVENFVNTLNGVFFAMIISCFVGLGLFSVFYAILAIAFVRGKQ